MSFFRKGGDPGSRRDSPSAVPHCRLADRRVAGIMAEKRNAMEKLCLSCLHCRRVPLDAADVASGIEPLLRCRKGRFDLREAHLLPAWSRSRRMCPEFDGEIEDSLEAGGAKHGKAPRTKPPVLSLATALPPALSAEVRRAVKGPCLLYVPSPRVVGGLHERIRKAYARLGSIRGTAKSLRCGRNTVRRVVRESADASRTANGLTIFGKGA